MAYTDQAKALGAQRRDIVTITIPKCSRTYGVSPCTAIGSVGQECYNTYSTCQDLANFSGTDSYTLTFCNAGPPDAYHPEALTWITSIRHSPTRVQYGSIAPREQLTVTIQSAPFAQAVDPYWKTRTYSGNQGDLFGRLLARFPFLAGRALTWQRKYGDEGITRHYVIDSVQGPDIDLSVSIVAKDVLKLADDRETEYPAASSTTITADLDVGDTTVVLSSNSEVVAGDYLIINKEVISLDSLSSGTTWNITRAREGTTEEDHASGDKVQLCKLLSGTPPEIITEILEDGTDIDTAQYIPTSEWAALTATDGPWESWTLRRMLVEPEGVSSLLGSLLEATSGSLHPDTESRKLRLVAQSGFEVPTTTLDQSIIWNVRRRALPQNQLTQISHYYGLIDASESDEDPNNYRGLIVSRAADVIDSNALGKTLNKTIYGKWWPSTAQAYVTLASQRILDQYREVPTEVTCELPHWKSLVEGQLVTLTAPVVQDVTGASRPVRMLVSSIDLGNPLGQRVTLINAPGPTESAAANTRTLTTPRANLNVYDFFDAPTAPGTYILIIPSGVTVYQAPGGIAALNTQGFDPSTQDVRIELGGDIVGLGGEGGDGGDVIAIYDTGSGTYDIQAGVGQNGKAGGNAVNATVDVHFFINNGNVWGGGGGGAGVFGSGSADTNSITLNGGAGGGGGGSFRAAPGGEGGTAQVLVARGGDTINLSIGPDGVDGSTQGGGAAGGVGAGAGGDFGQAGANSSDASGGAAGKAVKDNGRTITWETPTESDSAQALSDLQAAGQVLGAVT